MDHLLGYNFLLVNYDIAGAILQWTPCFEGTGLADSRQNLFASWEELTEYLQIDNDPLIAL